MFDQTFVNTQAQTRKPWTVLASLTLQASFVLALLIAPLLHIAKLDAPPKVPQFLRVEKVNLAAQPEVKPAARQSPVRRTVFIEPVLRAPVRIPRQIDMTPDAPSLVTTPETIGGTTPGLLAVLGSGVPVQRPPDIRKPEAAPAAKPPRPLSQLRVGGDVQAAKLIYSPRPSYPRLAISTHTQGTVVIRAVIARDGTIGNLQLIGGPPLLVQAAMDAVRQWRYKPTLLNGEPVEVLTEISVNFTLSR